MFRVSAGSFVVLSDSPHSFVEAEDDSNEVFPTELIFMGPEGLSPCVGGRALHETTYEAGELRRSWKNCI